MTEAAAGLDPLALGAAFLAGGALAALYLALLWRAVRDLARTPRPGVALVGGGLLRVTLVAAAFVLAAREGIAPLLAGVAGFTLVRLAVTRRVRAAPFKGDA